jgi:acyl dehydratase
VTEPGGREDEAAWHLGRVDGDAVVAYAMATNDHNDLYFRGLAAPPLFTVSLLLASHLEAGLSERPRVEGASSVVHGEHDTNILGPVLPGMALQWQSSLHGAHNTRGGVIETRRTVVYDRSGTPLVEHFWSNFSVKGRIGREFGLRKPDHTFPAEAWQNPLGARTVNVDRDQGFRYAGVSGDRVGHAIDDEIARTEGYPGKILQGLCTFGLCSGALVHLAAGGDPRRIRRLACRFSRPAFPGPDLEVRLYEVGEVDSGRRAFAFEAHQDERTVVKHGRVEVDGE